MATSGYVEQLSKPIFDFSATARRENGSTEPFSLAILPARHERDRGWYCVVTCPFLDDRPLRIFGVDQKQALKLAVDFVRRSLGHMGATLLDGEGNPVQIPDPLINQEPPE